MGLLNEVLDSFGEKWEWIRGAFAAGYEHPEAQLAPGAERKDVWGVCVMGAIGMLLDGDAYIRDSIYENPEKLNELYQLFRVIVENYPDEVREWTEQAEMNLLVRWGEGDLVEIMTDVIINFNDKWAENFAAVCTMLEKGSIRVAEAI